MLAQHDMYEQNIFLSLKYPADAVVNLKLFSRSEEKISNIAQG